MRALLLGAGNMGRAIGPADAAFEFTIAEAVVPNARLAAATGARVLVVGTSGWAHDQATLDGLEAIAMASGMRIVAGATFSVATVDRDPVRP